MRNKSWALPVLVVALVATAGMALLPAKAKVKVNVEGTWNVHVTPEAGAAAKGEKEFDDTLLLQKGKFHSSACDAYGFGQTPYRVEENHWMSDGVSTKEGKNHWHGEVTGDSVSGQMTWTKADGSVLNYTFTGTRAAAESQTKGSKKPGN